MEGDEMRGGFTLIEVLVTLCVIMVFFVGISKTASLAAKSCRYSDDLTYATMLGHSKLLSLRTVKFDSREMDLNWHQDPGNPIGWRNKKYYRFWQVRAVPLGKEVSMYVAWDDYRGGSLQNFTSVENLRSSKCPCIDFVDVFLDE